MKPLLAAVVTLFLSTSPSAQTSVQPDEPVYSVGGGVSAPRVTKEVKPQYSPDAMRDQVQGKLTLHCVVDREGAPTRIEVVEGLDERLDAKAVEAMEQWRFEPGKKDGAPVAVRIVVEMTFTLKQ